MKQYELKDPGSERENKDPSMIDGEKIGLEADKTTKPVQISGPGKRHRQWRVFGRGNARAWIDIPFRPAYRVGPL